MGGQLEGRQRLDGADSSSMQPSRARDRRTALVVQMLVRKSVQCLCEALQEHGSRQLGHQVLVHSTAATTTAAIGFASAINGTSGMHASPVSNFTSPAHSMTDPRNPAIFPIIAMATDGERQNHVVRREWICPKSQWSGKYSPLADSSSTTACCSAECHGDVQLAALA